MSCGLSIAFHAWRGIGADTQPDIFFWRWRFGVLTLSVDKADLFAAYAKLRAAIVERVTKDHQSK
ncbi:hypothetical protein [Nitrobacter sp.]|uniref:hypothetical protein n=1 Tax=Nitrobacter sp. TaxID=29420 RepID=UPI0029CABF24|nr:hypothetical protein [Nitrobacter sp.]